MNDRLLEPFMEPPEFERYERGQRKKQAKQDAIDARATRAVCRTKIVHDMRKGILCRIMERKTQREIKLYRRWTI